MEKTTVYFYANKEQKKDLQIFIDELSENDKVKKIN